MSQRWLIRLSVEGDLRFISHHDCLRAVERIVARAFEGTFALKYSQGFNPHPLMSLLCPRPVGVVSMDDIFIVSLERETEANYSDESAAGKIIELLNLNAPKGMIFLTAEIIPGKKSPPIQSVEYEIHLPQEKTTEIAETIQRLENADSWPIERKKRKGRRTSVSVRDIKPLVKNLKLSDEKLTWTHVSDGARWAKPAELLGMLGMDERIDLAKVVRRKVNLQKLEI